MFDLDGKRLKGSKVLVLDDVLDILNYKEDFDVVGFDVFNRYNEQGRLSQKVYLYLKKKKVKK